MGLTQAQAVSSYSRLEGLAVLDGQTHYSLASPFCVDHPYFFLDAVVLVGRARPVVPVGPEQTPFSDLLCSSSGRP